MSRACIYPGPHSQKISDEHFLPRALGCFEGSSTLNDRVCKDCNTEIGKRVETEFLRAGPIGFFRWLLGVRGRHASPSSPFYQRVSGREPIYIIGRAPDLPYDLLWEVEYGTENVYPLRQIVFEHPVIGTHPIPILDRMCNQPEELLEYLRERELEHAHPIRAFAAPDEIQWVERLLSEIGVTHPPNWTITTIPPQRIDLITTVNISEAHFRAVAKIAFHYTLKMFPDLTGMEREFTGIKDFIWHGSGMRKLLENPFVRQRRDQFVRNFRRGFRPTRWMHILSVKRGYTGIIAHAQFFVGPHLLSLPYEIRIGANPSRIITPCVRHAHQFVMLNPAAHRGPVGVMEDAQPANYILPV